MLGALRHLTPRKITVRRKNKQQIQHTMHGPNEYSKSAEGQSVSNLYPNNEIQGNKHIQVLIKSWGWGFSKGRIPKS